MGFADTFVEPKSNFIGKEEKAELVAQGLELEITSVSQRVSNFKDEKTGLPKQEWVLGVTLDGEDRAISFAVGVFYRDETITQMESYLAGNPTELPVVKLVKKGRAVSLEVVR